jgi:hypothetical protein
VKLLNFANFEMPAVFAKLQLRGGQPPVAAPGETRNAHDLVTSPRFGVYDPNALHFPDAQGPLVRGNSNVTMGVGMVEYGQATWDRSKEYECGPVLAFFQGVLFDNRVKHL